MPNLEIHPNFDGNVNRANGRPTSITIALAGKKPPFQQTTVNIGFIDAHGGPRATGVILNNDQRHTLVGNFPQGTTSLFITNKGPEIIHVSWAE